MSHGPKTQTTTQQTQANTFGQIAPQDTPDIQALRGFQFQADPSQPYIYARAHESLHNTANNPYGAYTTPAVRDAALRTGDMNLTQQQGQASAQENASLNNLRFGQQTALAELTAPHIVQTGGTSSGTGTSQQSGGLGQAVLGGFAQGAGAAAA